MATDNAGNTVTSSAVIDKVDHLGPSIASFVQSAAGSWTGTTSDTFTVKASDATSGVKSVEIYDGTKDLGAATLSGGSWTYTANNLADGLHNFTATVADITGNTTTSTVVTDKVDAKGTPTLGAIAETSGTQGSFSFTVTSQVAAAAGPGIQKVLYWIDKIASETMAPASASNAGALTLNGSGVGTAAITANTTGNVGSYFHAEAVDTLGHTSTVGNLKIT